MLADRKKRKKYCLNPQGNYWTNDKSKFGQKLLEKMGWEEGQGLGANNQGISERIKVRFRLNANAGLGFNESEDTLVQQEQYLSLLSTLNSKPVEPIDNSKVSSLEAKSKKSKARVHYKKFTRGKDLSRYSSKDLVGIFGIRETENELSSNEINEKCFDKHVSESSYELGNEQSEKSDPIDSVNTNNIETSSPSTLVNRPKKSKESKKSRKTDDAPLIKMDGKDENCNQEPEIKENLLALFETSNNPENKRKSKKRKRTYETSIVLDEENDVSNRSELVNAENPLKNPKKSKKRSKSLLERRDADCDFDRKMDNYVEDRQELSVDMNNLSKKAKKVKNKQKTRDNHRSSMTSEGSIEQDAQIDNPAINDSDASLIHKTLKFTKKKKLCEIFDSSAGTKILRDENCDLNRKMDNYVEDRLELSVDLNNLSKKAKKSKNKQKIRDSHQSNMLSEGSIEQDAQIDNPAISDSDVSHIHKTIKCTKKKKLCDTSDSSARTNIVEQDLSNKTCSKEEPTEAFSNMDRGNDRTSNRRNMFPNENGFRGSNLPVISGYAYN